MGNTSFQRRNCDGVCKEEWDQSLIQSLTIDGEKKSDGEERPKFSHKGCTQGQFRRICRGDSWVALQRVQMSSGVILHLKRREFVRILSWHTNQRKAEIRGRVLIFQIHPQLPVYSLESSISKAILYAEQEVICPVWEEF